MFFLSMYLVVQENIVHVNSVYSAHQLLVINQYYVQAPYPGTEQWLMNAVANIGPTTVGFNVVNSFYDYTGGVYSDSDCKTTSTNYLGGHAVVVIGYGTDSMQGDYWLLKNSWGASWGEQGYFKIARNKNNMCDVALYATYPLV